MKIIDDFQKKKFGILFGFYKIKNNGWFVCPATFPLGCFHWSLYFLPPLVLFSINSTRNNIYINSPLHANGFMESLNKLVDKRCIQVFRNIPSKKHHLLVLISCAIFRISGRVCSLQAAWSRTIATCSITESLG